MQVDPDDFIPLSALQHMSFCPRQCALIHVEQVWNENRSTAEGRVFHERVHEAEREWREGILITRGLRLASSRLGLSGVADVVEFHSRPDGCILQDLDGKWRPVPVEYKKGKAKRHSADRVQLCAQALCLEEMLSVDVPVGAIFYGKTRRRQEVNLDPGLRSDTERLIRATRRLLETGSTPPPEPGPKCRLCSLQPYCLPDLPGNVSSYIRQEIDALLGEAHEDAR